MKLIPIVLSLALLGAAHANDENMNSDSCDYTGTEGPIFNGPLVNSFRVLTKNQFGKDVYDCELRLRASGSSLSAAVPLFDFIGVQEVLEDEYDLFDACDGLEFVDSITQNGDYPYHQWGYPRAGGGLLDHGGDGGLGYFSRWNVSDFKSYNMGYGQVGHREHGFIFTRVWVSSIMAVDVYVVHLHSGSDRRSTRWNELVELSNAIHEQSASSGYPVLIMGDFNIGGPNPTASNCGGNDGYDDIMMLLGNPRDLWLEAHSQDSIEGATFNGNLNTLAAGSYKRIDFIFAPEHPLLTNSEYELVVANPNDVVLNKVSVRFDLWDSDHFGIEGNFEIRRRISSAAMMSIIL